MLEHRVELKIDDWDDVAFREAVDRAWAVVRAGSVDIDSTTAAAHLQLLVRAAGYPQAIVDVHKTVDEALAHVAHFEVRRTQEALSLAR
ncbi:MAG TPA: hypothetical protein VFX65_15025 [Candidatus Limnocylindrales bacterium]|nr:hypothetical protein [Candidatus Limnocylindrales bacterium]